MSRLDRLDKLRATCRPSAYLPPSRYAAPSLPRRIESVVAVSPDLLSFAMALANESLCSVRHVVSPPDADSGSIASGGLVRNGLDYWVCSGDRMRPAIAHAVLSLATAECERMLASRLVQLPNMAQSLALNVLQAGSSGYEWHYDPHAVTAVLYLTDHDDEGEFLWIDDSGELCAFQPRRGSMVVGPLSQIAHAVAPIERSPFRMCIPFGWGTADVPGIDEHSTNFIYGRSHAE